MTATNFWNFGETFHLENIITRIEDFNIALYNSEQSTIFHIDSKEIPEIMGGGSSAKKMAQHQTMTIQTSNH